MEELDERVLGSIPMIVAMAVFFGSAFALVFGLVALVMDGIFVLSDQAMMAGTAAGAGFLTVALIARRQMRREHHDSR